ncbi:hypothetical protein [Lacticaseibacillus suibinensis]|uniref:hypothetical protein n=1 Tax=Lacticaseibacillus suibinensis TaxID=2486011 RepID=UPI000F79233C|nr:hypothetical protein [Lacticaseibacillus suibinensis]
MNVKDLFEFLLIHFRFCYTSGQKKRLLKWVSKVVLPGATYRDGGRLVQRQGSRTLLVVNFTAPRRSFIGPRKIDIEHEERLRLARRFISVLALVALILCVFTASIALQRKEYGFLVIYVLLMSLLYLIFVGIPQAKSFSNMATLATALMIAQSNNRCDLYLIDGYMSHLPEKLYSNHYAKIIYLRDVYCDPLLYFKERMVDGVEEVEMFSASKFYNSIMIRNVEKFGDETIPTKWFLSVNDLESCATKLLW